MAAVSATNLTNMWFLYNILEFIMDVILDTNLGPAYRLYALPSGMFVRVRLEKKQRITASDAHRAFVLHFEEADAGGEATGCKLPPYAVTVDLLSNALPTFAEYDALPAHAEDGALASVSGLLFECLDGRWQERGPIPAGASAGLAEMLCHFDRTVRGYLPKAEQAFLRMKSDADFDALIGHTPFSEAEDLL